MMAALDHGPAHLPQGLFAGSPERVLAGMKVHANTISHARLVALEDTFPRTRELIGHERFNAQSRLFLKQPGVTALAMSDIGLGFDRFLAAQGEGPGPSDLARFEWLWLAAYHAANAMPLDLAALAGIAPEVLLEVVVQRHPAASASRFDPSVNIMIGKEVAGAEEAAAILIARPFADVLISPATDVMAAMLHAADRPNTIGNLLALAGEHRADHGEVAEASKQALVALLDAGALTRT